MKQVKIGILLIILSFLLLLSACIIKDSPAPGCIEYVGFAPMGGCNGKTIITDLVLEGFPECVQVSVNNCNGGVLEVQNNCSETLKLNGVEIPADSSDSLDIWPAADDRFELIKISSNFSDFSPSTDQRIEIIGSLDHHTVRLAFIKTAPLCE